jgi:hypothetical protein
MNKRNNATIGRAAMSAPSPERNQLMTRKTIDIDAYLAKRRQIAIIWCVADVLEIRPDLSGKQAWAVLQQAKDSHDASTGVSYDTLEWIADDLFGDAPETDEGEGE